MRPPVRCRTTSGRAISSRRSERDAGSMTWLGFERLAVLGGPADIVGRPRTTDVEGGSRRSSAITTKGGRVPMSILRSDDAPEFDLNGITLRGGASPSRGATET